jgi:cation diffusion facilitator family transporter
VLTRFALLSIAAAIVTIGLKAGAYLVTGSVGLLSDAIESGVNLVAALGALAALLVAARPPDHHHDYGHEKVEYFSSGFEGALILVAAGGIAYAAIERLLAPAPLDDLGIGLAVSVVATAINLAVALVLRQAGRRYRSVTLEADSQHILTDVWTTGGVIVGIALVALTGWLWLDSAVALVVAANIVWSGVQLLRETAHGLTDAAVPDEDRARIEAVLNRECANGVGWHGLKTRMAGPRRFVEVHISVPGDWPVAKAHEIVATIEREIEATLPGAVVQTHLDPAAAII